MGKNYYEGKTVWVTGASSGIGEAIVHQLSGKCARIIISANNKEELERVKASCNMAPGSIIVSPFDLLENDRIKLIAEDLIRSTGGIDILFNIGGISQRSLVENTPEEVDRKIMEINYFGTIALTKALLPHMIARGSGHLIATSSISGRFGFPLRSAYSASKHALHGFFETLRIETRRQNISVSILIPGRVRTNISLNALTSDGKSHGVMDKGQDQGITAHKAAKQILRGVQRKKFEILVGQKELLMLYIRKFIPVLFFRIAGRISAV